MTLLRRLLATALVAGFALAPAAAQARVTAADAAAPVLVVGDSLAVGLRPYLAELLGEDVAWDAKAGRTTPQGLVALRTALQTVQPRTVVVSLGTNDGPDPARFKSRIDRALSAIGPQACVIWPTIFRPARKGPYVALNDVLSQEAARVRRLQLVTWDKAVARKSVRLPDGLHPDAAGFAYRSQMIARAVREGCMPTVAEQLDTSTDGTGGVASPG